MAEFYLVRHGQASFGKADYDQLSELGYQQSEWLGEYFAERNIKFDGVIRGAMKRHHQTAESICKAMQADTPHEIDEGLNEFDFESVVRAYLADNPAHTPAKQATPAEYYRLLKNAMHSWSNEQLDSSLISETWQDFSARVENTLQHVCQRRPEKPLLLVSSGGAMSVMMGHVLGLSIESIINLNMQTKNASFSHFYFNRDKVTVNSFNSIPHLDRPSRLHAVTYS
ncbi:histidine phosphatase family protein [Aestuariibacter salexigens]|uniref:histidine phosphatase family protein n=1 Tax=Aestuariibacter salexigens TaxID=226010 RepID=UPI00040C812C|nr:histidine phosphatase family protein [Aestuariibacter salexigens]